MFAVLIIFDVVVFLALIVLLRFMSRQWEINQSVADYIEDDMKIPWMPAAKRTVAKLRGEED